MKDNTDQEELVREASRLLGSIGGKETLKKHGTQHYKSIAKKSHAARRLNKLGKSSSDT